MIVPPPETTVLARAFRYRQWPFDAASGGPGFEKMGEFRPLHIPRQASADETPERVAQLPLPPTKRAFPAAGPRAAPVCN
jgi:hypothetical protein